MSKIIKAKHGMSYEKMLSTGKIIQLEKDYYAGDVIDKCYIMPGAIFNDSSEYYESGTFVRMIPLENIDIVETHTNLSSYGFIKHRKLNRWFRI